jgi:hypothetical protein
MLVAVNHLPAYHSPSNFPSPSVYDPTRFLSSSSSSNNPSSTQSTPPPAIFEPFLVGRHSCIGSRFAWSEMRLVLARLVWAFDFEPADDDGNGSGDGDGETETGRGEGKGDGKGKRMGVDWLKQKTHIFWEKEGLRVKLVMRGQGNNGA